MEKVKKDSTWGYVAIGVGVLSLFTPKLFLNLILILLVIFIIIGLVRDGSKIPSVVAMVIPSLILYYEFNSAMKSASIYRVQYEVECQICDVTYTNETGGSDKETKVRGGWNKTLFLKGDDFLHLSAQNGNVNASITARIYVNDVLLKEESSTGEYQIASVYDKAKSIDGY